MHDVACAVEYSIYQDSRPLHFVEDQIIVDHQHAIPERDQFGIARNIAGERVAGEALQAGFKPIERFGGGTWTLGRQI